MEKRRLALWVFGLLLIWLSFAPEADARRRARGLRWKIGRGDLTLRLGAGLEGIAYSTINDWKWIGSKGQFKLHFAPEVGYFLLDHTALVLAVPMDLEINEQLGAIFSLDVALGARHYFLPFLYVRGMVQLQILAKTRLRIGFGGVTLGLGGSAWIFSSGRLFVELAFPFNFVEGFEISALLLLGLDLFF